VVQVDAHLAVVVALVAEGVLDAHLVARRRVREDVVAHGLGGGAVEVDLVVVEDDVRPAAAAVDGEAGVLALVLVVVHRLRADEVRHGALAGGAERVLGRLGRLEQHVGLAVAVELARRLAGRRDVVALLGVNLRDGRDRVRPQLLRLKHLRLRHRRRSRHVRHRRVVQVDAHLAVVVALVAEGVLDAHLVARGRVREDVVAHRLGGGAVEVDLVVVELDVLPAAAAVDGEAGVLALVLGVVHRLSADEVGHGALAGGAEGVLGRLGRLEQNIAVAVAVQLARRLASRRDIVALLGIHLGDLGDGLGPQLLRREDVRLGDIGLAGGVLLGLAVEEGLDQADSDTTNSSTADHRRQDHLRGIGADDRRGRVLERHGGARHGQRAVRHEGSTAGEEGEHRGARG